MHKIGRMVLFFSEKDLFSNWFRCRFTVKGVTFNCVEQAMMYSKARLFGDVACAERILAAEHPRDQKRLGREVQGFDEALWIDRRVPIVRALCLAKFSQNPHLADALLSTDNLTLVEASPYDEIWGVKLAANDLRILDRRNWRGLNLLGEVLGQVRDELARTQQRAVGG